MIHTEACPHDNQHPTTTVHMLLTSAPGQDSPHPPLSLSTVPHRDNLAPNLFSAFYFREGLLSTQSPVQSFDEEKEIFFLSAPRGVTTMTLPLT